MAASARQEQAWVREAQGGSASAFEALFRLHWPQAFRAAFLVVHDAAAAEDIAQEAFLAALRHLDRFDRSRPLRGEAGLEEAVAREHRAELSDDVIDALADLTPEHRGVIVLRHLLGYTPGEIAA